MHSYISKDIQHNKKAQTIDKAEHYFLDIIILFMLLPASLICECIRNT
jgi:hypothetical protein